jgi:hypothetical protein
MEAILVAGIGAIATVFAAWLSNKSSTKRVRDSDRSAIDPVARLSAVAAAGAAATTAALLLLLMMRTLPSRSTAAHGLRGFSGSSVVPLIEDLKRRDADAADILTGAGSKQMPDSEGTIWHVGQVLYVSRPETIREIVYYPVGARPDFSTETSCTLQPQGKLTVRGFRGERKEALLEYAAPPSPAGCANATLLFYPLDPTGSNTLSQWFDGRDS